MTDKKIIDEYINLSLPEDTRSNALNIILLEVNSGKLALHTLVETLGDYLQNRDNLLRSRGTLLLSEVLCRLPSLKLNEHQLSFLGEFYTDRLKDYACASEVVKGIYAIVAHHRMEYPLNQRMLRALFSEVHPSSLPQTHRKMVMQVIDILLARHLPEVQAMGADFMVGYLQWIDGEKDPRNIIFSFNLLPTIVRCIPEYKNFADSLFEILSCYFPISFNPKQTDPNAITRDDLVNSLLNCFSITPLFAEYSIPFLLEKISGNVVDTKIESLKTLAYCCNKYGAEPIKSQLEDIWGTLSTQILTNKSNQVIDESKKTVFSITKSLSSNSAILELFLTIINKECIHHIKNSQDSKLAVSCASILFQTISASTISSRIVLSFVLPHLLEFYNLVTSQIESDPVHKSNEQLSIIGLLNDLLKANIISFQTLYEPSQETQVNPIDLYTDRLYDLFIGLLSNQSILVRSLSVECLSNLYISIESQPSININNNNNSQQQSPTFILEKEKRQIIIKTFISFLNDNDDNLRTKSLDSLMTIAKNEQIEILNDYAIPTLLFMINDDKTNNNNDNNDIESKLKETKYYLSAFTLLCSIKSLFQSVLPQIQQLLIQNIKSKYQSNDEYLKSLIIIENIQLIFKSIDESTLVDGKSIILQLIGQLFKMVLGSSSSPSDFKQKIFDNCILIIQSLIQNINKLNQIEIIEKMINIYIYKELTIVKEWIGKEEELNNWNPFENNDQLILIEIFAMVLMQAKYDVIGEHQKSSIQLQQILFDMSIKVQQVKEKEGSSNQQSISLICSQCLASITNKSKSPLITIDFINDRVLPIIRDESKSKQDRLNALHLLEWITKGYVVTGSQTGIQLAKSIGELISIQNESIAMTSAHSFDIILKSNDNGVMSVKSGANVNVLYQQKFFTLVFPTLLDSFKSTNVSYYLVAITNLLRNVPKEVLLSELGEVLPIVIQSLQQSNNIDNQNNNNNNQNNNELLESSLDTLGMLVRDVPNSIASYLESVVPSLIKLSTKGQLLKIRQSSLEILTLVATSLPYPTVFPYKQSVINGIIPALDDHKRLVRKQASTCRNTWFILQSAGK